MCIDCTLFWFHALLILPQILKETYTRFVAWSLANDSSVKLSWMYLWCIHLWTEILSIPVSSIVDYSWPFSPLCPFALSRCQTLYFLEKVDVLWDPLLGFFSVLKIFRGNLSINTKSSKQSWKIIRFLHLREKKRM